MDDVGALAAEAEKLLAVGNFRAVKLRLGYPTLSGDIAAVRAVSDSPWSLVAKMDTAEVYAPVHERLWLTILLVSLLLIGAGAGIGAVRTASSAGVCVRAH